MVVGIGMCGHMCGVAQRESLWTPKQHRQSQMDLKDECGSKHVLGRPQRRGVW